MFKQRMLLTIAAFGLMTGSSLGALAEDSPQQQGDLTKIVSPIFEVSAGAESNSLGTTSPCMTGCGSAPHSTDMRSGPIVRFGFQGVNASELVDGKGGYKIAFLPVSMIVDGGGTDGFGHVAGAEGNATPIRQILGALVEASYSPGTGAIAFRGKLVRIDYDRDKGIFDWRALDASVGLHSAIKISGKTTFDIELDVGGNVGGLHLNNMADISHALNISPAFSSAATVNPYAALRAGVYSESIKVELIASAEHRVDLTPASSRPVYGGRELGVDSDHGEAKLELEYIFNQKGLQQMGSRMSVFADAALDLDTLTLGSELFGAGDVYRSFMGLGGFRVQF